MFNVFPVLKFKKRQHKLYTDISTSFVDWSVTRNRFLPGHINQEHFDMFDSIMCHIFKIQNFKLENGNKWILSKWSLTVGFCS